MAYNFNKRRRHFIFVSLNVSCRYTVFSPKDGQPCMDHDRASGEVRNKKNFPLMQRKSFISV